jgi:hypothetical protein
MSTTKKRSGLNTTGAKWQENKEMSDVEVRAMFAQLVTQLREAQALRQMQDANRPPTEAEIAAGIDRTMREVITQDTRNPQALIPEAQMQRENVRPAGAPVVQEVKPHGEGRGFVEPKALPIHSAKGSSEEALIDAMVKKFVGGPNQPVK